MTRRTHRREDVFHAFLLRGALENFATGPYHAQQRQAVRRAAPAAHGLFLLAPDHSRIVIEVDGVQHYGRPNRPDEKGRITHTAVPRLYAEMVAEDRRLRLAGYEIYRFSDWELTGPGGQQILAGGEDGPGAVRLSEIPAPSAPDSRVPPRQPAPPMSHSHPTDPKSPVQPRMSIWS
ncbi:hypothetical protein ACFC4G_38910 [Streptomyces sp. NPDC056002]|uniref:hypothetical protein n=1 Tax=Streptomyces sp. NPDC056002 TaxID=3345675 RepID=UPI0035D92A01